ncbi:hypothetical protein LC613_42020 [Nostoc sphaeroides CHAB 2801]|uniref:hypothetical protein n=1 Tax=Nostoc sphaeroides TaxID=446679 RepID=UPI001E538F34|nr:hypothetical protein [Nostoc sphaeroides]MCC5633989.1 hypothetical protein [Nostoc sphaeroides CHAB 2801]
MKKVFIALLLALLLGCSANARTQQKSSAKASGTTDFPRALALKDGKKEPAQFDVYRQEFEKFKKLCVENDDDLAGMVYAYTKKNKAAGYDWSTNLDTMQSFVEMAESGFERKPVRCIQVYQLHLQNLQELNQPSK